MKNLFRYLLILLLVWLPSLMAAAPVDVHTARKKAAEWLSARSARSVNRSALQLDKAAAGGYLFSNATDFVLMAADDELPEVLAYGAKGEGTLPLSLLGYIEAPKQPRYVERKKVKAVAPLLPFVRHQKAPYNNHCPLYKDDNGEVTRYHCLVGCVATALEEVISYYRREVVLQDTLHGWETAQYVISDVLPGTKVDCRLIRNNYDVDDYSEAEADAVSRLSYYCGVAAHMRWGIASSGANVRNLVDPMQRAFGYPYVKYLDSYEYAPADWLQLVRNELYAARPVLYAAFDMWIRGHAFVVDGLDEDGFFHVNWGYGGSYDGYFRLDVLNFNEPLYDQTISGSEAGFFCNHQALLLCPDKVEENLPQPLERDGMEIAIDSITVDRPAETGKRTPMTVYFRNTTDRPLTTPFEFFTNLPSDTAIFDQADFIALCGTILAPHEQRTMRIHADFSVTGSRLLRVSPDGDTVCYERPVEVKQGVPSQLTFDIVGVTFPESDRALVTLHISNAAGAGYGGQELIYEAGPGTPDVMKDGVRHSRHIYVDAGTTLTDTASFRGLQPGELYTLLIRSPWKVKTQTTFRMPFPQGIGGVEEENLPAERWYRPDGQIIARPAGKGIYLRKKENKTNKVYIK